MKKYCLVLMVPLLFGCGASNHGDLQAWMDESSKGLKGKVTPVPEIQAYEPVAYTAMALLSPFDTSKIEPEGGRKGPSTGNSGPDFGAREARNNIMEKYPLESMTVIGYMNINNKPMAAIQVEQMVKQVKIGDYIGLDFGVIIGISDHEIVIRESVEDSGGEWLERTSTLRLQTREDRK